MLPDGYSEYPGCKNIALSVLPNDQLALLLNLTRSFGKSSSGKTTIIASSVGNRPVGQTGLILGLNCFSKPDPVLVEKAKQVLNDRKIINGNGFTIELFEDRFLKIVMDCANDLGPSSTGNSILVASSAGNIALGSSGVSLGLNCYHKVNCKVNLEKLVSASSAEAQHQNLTEFQYDSSADVLCFCVDLQCKPENRDRRGRLILARTSPIGYRIQRGEKSDATLFIYAAATDITFGEDVNTEYEPLKPDCAIEYLLDADRKRIHIRAPLGVANSDTEQNEDDEQEADGPTSDTKKRVLFNIVGTVPHSNIFLTLRGTEKLEIDTVASPPIKRKNPSEDPISKKQSKVKSEPSLEELPTSTAVHEFIRTALKEVDEDNVTLKDLLTQAASQFNCPSRLADLRPIVKKAMIDAVTEN